VRNFFYVGQNFVIIGTGDQILENTPRPSARKKSEEKLGEGGKGRIKKGKDG
jgi:hypothetical protein